MNFSSIFKSISNYQFPYTIEDTVVHQTSLWQVFYGTRKADSMPVTIFKANRTPETENLILNAVKKSKILKIPGLCPVLETFETDVQNTYIVTERVNPFPWETLNRLSRNKSCLQNGISQLLTTLQFLSSFTFGALSTESIYIDAKGNWVLFGWELCYNTSEIDPSQYDRLVNAYYSIMGLQFSTTNPKIIDAVQFEKLIRSILGPAVPGDWKTIVTQLGKGSMKLGKFFESLKNTPSWYNNPLVSLYQDLKELHIKDEHGKLAAMTSLQNIFLDSKSLFENMTPNIITGFLIPELISILNLLFVAQQTSPNASSKIVSFMAILLTLTTQNEYYPEEFKTMILNAFKLPDRQTRFLLLIYLPKLVEPFGNAMMSEKIYPNFVQGLADSDSTLRLQTLKSTPIIVPCITERQLNNDLLRYLAKTQVDTDVEIRTWTVLIITKVSSMLSASSNRASILATAYTKSLKDPKIKPRLAALHGLEKSIELLDANTIANKILTVIAPGLLDKNPLVRSKAKKLFNTYLAKLEQEAQALQTDSSYEVEDATDINFDDYDNDENELCKKFMENLRLSAPTMDDVFKPSTVPSHLTENDFDDNIDDGWNNDDNWEKIETTTQPNAFAGKKVKIEESWNDDLNKTTFEVAKKSMPGLKLKSTVNSTKKSIKQTQASSIKSSLASKVKQAQKRETTLKLDDEDEDGWDDGW